MNVKSMKKYLITLIAGIILLAMITYFLISKSSNDEPIKVSWSDDINNKKNEEFLAEVFFNIPDSITVYSIEHIQFLFCERYYKTLSDSSKQWYNKMYEYYRFNSN